MRSMLFEGRCLKPSARTLWEVQAFAQHPPMEAATNLYTSIRDRAMARIEEARAARRSLQSPEDLEMRRQQMRSGFLSAIGGLPGYSEVPKACVTGRSEQSGFALENVILETRPGYFATCAVYSPLPFTGKRPAVLLLIGHTDAGKADPEYQYAAQLFCRAGFTVLALDPYGEGERFEHYSAENDDQPIQGCSGEHDLMDWKFKLMGKSLARYFIADALAAARYLKSRPDADGRRVALTGHSGGGTQVSMLMLAAGEEFACAAPCAYITDNQAMLEEGVDPDNEMIWPGSIEKGIDCADILLGMAPKPVAVLSNAHDFFPLEGTQRAVDEARAVLERTGAVKKGDPSPIELYIAQSEHAYGPTLARAALSLLSRSLLGRDTSDETLKDFRFDFLPPQRLEAAGGCILKARPDMKTLQDEARELLAETQARRNTALPLKERLGALLSAKDEGVSAVRIYREGVCAPYAYYCFTAKQEAGIWLNGAILRPMYAPDGPMPTVIMLWPGGTSRIAEHSHLIHRAQAEGKQAVILDLPGEGALLPAKLGGSDMYISWSTMYKLNAYLIQLGDSLCALRTRGVMAACRALEIAGFVKTDTLCLYGEGDEGRYASLAGVMCGLPAETDSKCQSYEEIVFSEYHDQTHTHAWALPGALDAFGSEEIEYYFSRRTDT